MAIRSYRGVAPTLGPGAWVDPAALVIGDVELGVDASIWPFVLIRGDVNRIRITAQLIELRQEHRDLDVAIDQRDRPQPLVGLHLPRELGNVAHLGGRHAGLRVEWNHTFVMRLDLALSPLEPGRLSAYSAPGHPF